MVHRNSIQVYHTTKHKHPTKRNQIISALEFMGKATMHRVAEYLKVPVHTISGRFGELRNEGHIKEVSKTDENKTIWKLSTE